jgi:hypothetical protein
MKTEESLSSNFSLSLLQPNAIAPSFQRFVLSSSGFAHASRLRVLQPRACHLCWYELSVFALRHRHARHLATHPSAFRTRRPYAGDALDPRYAKFLIKLSLSLSRARALSLALWLLAFQECLFGPTPSPPRLDTSTDKNIRVAPARFLLDGGHTHTHTRAKDSGGRSRVC